MLIRSQDKKTLIDMSNIQLYADPKNRIVSSSALERNGSYILLGEYSTEKKAMKVLDEIQRFHSAMVGFKNNLLSLDDVQVVMGNRFTDFDFYQMPTDDEVEV